MGERPPYFEMYYAERVKAEEARAAAITWERIARRWKLHSCGALVGWGLTIVLHAVVR